jgi:two-component system, OmpR family, response regulator RegX3
LLVVDDDLLTGATVRAVLTDEDCQIETVRTGAEAIAHIRGHDAALVLLEQRLPDIDGFTLLAELRARRYTGPVMFVSSVSHVETIAAAFHHGADDYLVKPFEPMELLARITAILRRRYERSQQALGSILRVGDAELDVRTLTYWSAVTPPTVLTPTESRMLECLMRNVQIVISRETLIERVWGDDCAADTNRVDVYIRRLRSKIEGPDNHGRYLQTIRGAGYVFRPSDDSVAVPPTREAHPAGADDARGSWSGTSTAAT